MQHFGRILGKRNKSYKGKCLIVSTVILEGYLSICVLRNSCFFISVNKADPAYQVLRYTCQQLQRQS